MARDAGVSFVTVTGANDTGREDRNDPRAIQIFTQPVGIKSAICKEYLTRNALDTPSLVKATLTQVNNDCRGIGGDVPCLSTVQLSEDTFLCLQGLELAGCVGSLLI